MKIVLDWASKVLWGVGTVTALGVGLLYFFQEKILYVPRLPGVPDQDPRLTPDRWGFDHQDVWLSSADGTRLHAWLLVPRGMDPQLVRSRPVLMFLQENAGNMSHRLPFLRALALNLRVPIFAPSYRGYGQSGGAPSERGIAADARAFLAHLSSRDDVDGSRVVLFGRSLGGAVAIHLAAELEKEQHGGQEGGEQGGTAAAAAATGAGNRATTLPIAALLVENTFTSVEDMVGRVVPPLGALMGTGYESIVRGAEQAAAAARRRQGQEGEEEGDEDDEEASALAAAAAARPRGKALNPLVTNKWRNLDAVRRVPGRVPVLLMASVHDEMIPFPQMKALHHVLKASRRRRGGGGGGAGGGTGARAGAGPGAAAAARDPAEEGAAARRAAAAAALARAEGRANTSSSNQAGGRDNHQQQQQGEQQRGAQQARGVAPPAPVVWQEWPRSGHMDAYDTEPVLYWQTLRDFMDAHVHRS